MKQNIQLILSNYEMKYTDLTVYLNSDENEFYIYMGVALLECVSISAEEIGHKMFIGRLYNAGASLSILSDRFHHDARTIKKWALALKTSNVEKMAEAFGGRKAQKKVKPELIRYVMQQYNNRKMLGRSYRAKIINGVKEVFSVPLSPSLVSSIFKHNKSTEVKKNISESTKIMDDLGHSNLSSCSKSVRTVNQSPILKIENIVSLKEEMIHHAGLILFELYLSLYANFQKQIISQLLLGAINIEQSKSLCFESLSRFNEKVEINLDKQRKLLDKYATKENELDLYRQNASLLSDGPNSNMIFYFDSHTKKYTGELKILKGWCGSLHSVSKVINLDAFHTESGRPCFIQHYTPYYDMRERFFMSLQLFDQLFEPNKREGRTFIIDRGIFGLECFKRFHKDFLITWEKGYDGSGWDENKPSIQFKKYRQKNSKKGKKKEYSFDCQEQNWNKLEGFRRIIVKATNDNKNTITVSVLCSNPNMDIATIVWLIFNRWLQENDFKYLNVHYGINQLDSKSRSNFEENIEELIDRDVDSIEYKKAKKETKLNENKLAKNLLKKNQNDKKILIKSNEIKKLNSAILISSKPSQKVLNKELRKAEKRLEKLKEKKVELKEEHILLEKKLEASEENQSKILRKTSRIQELIKANYKVIETKRKGYIDALRINAANIFRNVGDEFRVIYDNYRDDHFHLRMLINSPGLISTRKNELNIKLWLPGSLQKHIIRKMHQLTDKIAMSINENNLNSKKLKIELINGTIASL